MGASMDKLDTKKIADRIESLCKRDGIAVSKMLSDLEFGKNTVDNLRTGSMPSIAKVLSMAEYFNVSLHYMIGLSDNPGGGDNGIIVGNEYTGKAQAIQNTMPEGLDIKDASYIVMIGSDGEKKRIVVPQQKVGRLQRLIEAGMPELLEDEEDIKY